MPHCTSSQIISQPRGLFITSAFLLVLCFTHLPTIPLLVTAIGLAGSDAKCAYLKEIGFDVAAKVSAVMQAAFPQRMVPCELFAAMAKAKALGQKTGGGIYGKDGTGDGPGRAVRAATVPASPPTSRRGSARA